jgi:hypothetical protein
MLDVEIEKIKSKMRWNSRYYLYVLVHKELNKIFYVGYGALSKRGKEVRWVNHVHMANRGSHEPVYRYIRSVWAKGETVEFVVKMKGLTRPAARDFERRLIVAIGLDNLTNMNKA